MQVHPGRQHVPGSARMIGLQPAKPCNPRFFAHPPFATVGEISNNGVTEAVTVESQLMPPPRHRGQQHLGEKDHHMAQAGEKDDPSRTTRCHQVRRFLWPTATGEKNLLRRVLLSHGF